MVSPTNHLYSKFLSGLLSRMFAPAFVFGIVVGALVVYGGNATLEATSSNDFCISCHEMKSFVQPGYEASIHYRNASGIRVGCADCHVPRALLPKLMRKTAALSEVYHALVGTIATPEKFATKRPELDRRVWDSMIASDSRECRECHSLGAMDLHRQSPAAAEIKAKLANTDGTCITCHKGIGHQRP